MIVHQQPPSFGPNKREERELNFYSPGARDLLPLDVAQKHWIEDRLQQVFHRWSYHKIITSTIERLDTLMAGGAIQRSTVIQVQDASEEMLGLRPELTASIARASVARMTEATNPQRLYYIANVFRRSQPLHHGRQQEFHQAGVELLGSSGLLADAEVLLLLADCLDSLSLGRWRLILGEAGLVRSLLAPFPTALQDKVRFCIAHLDWAQMETLPLSSELKERALFLFNLRGHPSDVLQRVSGLELDQAGWEIVNKLKLLIELVNDSFTVRHRERDRPFPLILDLSLVRNFDYYTGIVFEAVSDGESRQRVLGQGGRYDQLLGLYHPQGQTYPGIGFSLNIEDIYQVLLSTRLLPRQTPVSDWLVVPLTPHAQVAAFVYAQTLRDSTHPVRVEMDLGGREPAQIREYARCRNITRIAWVKAEGAPEIEPIT